MSAKNAALGAVQINPDKSQNASFVLWVGHPFTLRRVPTNTEIFCAVYDYAGKQILVRAIGIEKENWG